MLKQVVVSMVVILLTAGIFAGVVLHTVALMRQTQLQILTGEYAASREMK